MGLIPSHLSLSGGVNTLQSALPRRSDRRVEPEPVPQILSLSVNSPVLTARKDRHRRFRTRFRKRSRKRNSCSCLSTEDDDYASVFGRVRSDSTQSLPLFSSVRCCRPDYPSPLPPSAEYRLLVENIEVHGHAAGSTYHEQTTTTTTQVNSETRVVLCRHCRNGVSTCESSASSSCATPLSQPTSHPVCRACCWHNKLPHDCGCFGGPPISFLSWDGENTRCERNISTPLIPACGRPRTRFSVVTTATPEPEEPKSRKIGYSPSSEDHVVKPESLSEQNPVPEPEKPETSPCVCAIPSKKPCPCDKQLFEAMNPWNKCKTVLFVFLIFALTVWITTFIILR